MAFYTSKALHTRLKAHAALRNITISKLLERIIVKYLEENDK